MAGLRIGVDLGGTKIEAVCLSSEGRTLSRKRIATPQGDYDAIINAIVELVRRLSVGPDEVRVGVGTPGSVSPLTGLMRNANSTCLNGRRFEFDLKAALGLPMRIANDADCFAMSEAADGAGAGEASVFGVILGTGVGGGFVLNGRLVRGANGVAGEWGHNPMPDADGKLPCWCGRENCVETWLSGPALAADHLRCAGAEMSAEEIVAAAGKGDEAAAASLGRYTARLGRALAGVVNIVDPDVIVLGGGLSNIAALYEDTPDAMAGHVFSDHISTRIVQNFHGDSSGVRGAAWLWGADEPGGER